MIREVDGPRAKFERYAADMLYVVASKGQLDTDTAKRFGEILEEYYANPFEKKKKKMSAADIKSYVSEKLRSAIDKLGSE